MPFRLIHRIKWRLFSSAILLLLPANLRSGVRVSRSEEAVHLEEFARRKVRRDTDRLDDALRRFDQKASIAASTRAVWYGIACARVARASAIPVTRPPAHCPRAPSRPRRATAKQLYLQQSRVEPFNHRPRFVGLFAGAGPAAPRSRCQAVRRRAGGGRPLVRNPQKLVAVAKQIAQADEGLIQTRLVDPRAVMSSRASAYGKSPHEQDRVRPRSPGHRPPSRSQRPGRSIMLHGSRSRPVRRWGR